MTDRRENAEGAGSTLERVSDGAASGEAAAATGWQRLVNSPTANKLALMAAALTWGFSFFVAKDVTDAIPVFWLLALRFGIATLVTFAVFGRHLIRNLNAPTIRAGVVLGLCVWGAYAFQTVGLVYTTPGKNAFLTGVYVVLVPFVAWLFRMGRPKIHDLVAAGLCLAGIGFTALSSGFTIGLGDALTLACAIFYALQIVVVGKMGRELDVWALTIWQFLVMTVCSVVIMPFEPVPSASVWTPSLIWQLLFLGVICSFACLGIMNYALTKIPVTEGSLISSLESPSGVFFSVMAGRETLTARMVFGFCLIFLAMLISNAWDSFASWLRSRRTVPA